MLLEIFKGLLLTKLTDMATGEYSYFKMGIQNFLDKEVKKDCDYLEVLKYVIDNMRDCEEHVARVFDKETREFFSAISVEMTLLNDLVGVRAAHLPQ